MSIRIKRLMFFRTGGHKRFQLILTKNIMVSNALSECIYIKKLEERREEYEAISSANQI